MSGRRPSQEKRRTYAEARRQFRMWHVLPEQLPPDCTWVEPYGWGGLTPEAATAVGAGAVEQPADTVATVAT